MSVQSYIEKRASEAVLSTDEKASIDKSIQTLRSRLDGWFAVDLREHFRFGSSTRGTILPRLMNANSDIDYMIVWNEGGYKPQTYLDRLRRFVEYYYSRSEIKQSSPTIVLELNHIKFDLVPALHWYSGTYQIPDGATSWQYTNPTEFSKTLEAKNGSELYKIKPTIRLAKYWNARTGVYESFSLEKWIVGLSYFGIGNSKDYLFRVFDEMSSYQEQQWRAGAIQRAKAIISKVREYEKNDMPYSAEAEIKKLLPE